MRFWNWLKGIGWISAIGTILTAVVFAAMGIRARNKAESARKKGELAEQLLNSQISSEIEKGKKLRESANVDKDKAEAAKIAAQDKLDKMGGENETIDDIAHRFNSERVRFKPTTRNS